MEYNRQMFNKNISALKIYNPQLAKKLEEYPLEKAQKQVSAHKAASGDFIIAYNNIALDDMQNPIEKAKNIWTQMTHFEFEKNDIAVIFGLGLGYLFKRAYVSASSRILLYEPSLDVLRFVFEYVDLSEQLLDSRVCLCNTEDDCANFLSVKYIVNDRIEVVFSPVYANLYPDLLTSFTKRIVTVCESKNVDMATIKVHSKSWLENDLKNLSDMKQGRAIGLLKNAFAGKTALIVGAGPSLKKDIELIKANRSKFVIFAVNKIFDFLIENGIMPDFFVVSDSSYVWMCVKSPNEVFKQTNLLITTKGDYEFSKKNFKKKVYYFLKNDEFFKELALMYPEVITLGETEGSVVSQALYGAVEMGFSNIVFSGFDLAIKPDEAYAQDIKIQNIHDDIIKVGDEIKRLCSVKSFDGKIIETRSDYKLFISQFESAFDKIKNVSFYNTTDFGAYIKGMIYLSLSEIIAKLELTSIDADLVLENSFAATENIWQRVIESEKDILKKQIQQVKKLHLELKDFISQNTLKIINYEECSNEQRALIQKKEVKLIKDLSDNQISALYLQVELLDYLNKYKENPMGKEVRDFALKIFAEADERIYHWQDWAEKFFN